MIHSGATPLSLPAYESANDNRPVRAAPLHGYGPGRIDPETVFRARSWQRSAPQSFSSLAEDLATESRFKRRLVTFSNAHLAMLQSAVPAQATQPVDAGRAYNAARRTMPGYDTVGRVLSTSA